MLLFRALAKNMAPMTNADESPTNRLTLFWLNISLFVVSTLCRCVGFPIESAHIAWRLDFTVGRLDMLTAVSSVERQFKRQVIEKIGYIGRFEIIRLAMYSFLMIAPNFNTVTCIYSPPKRRDSAWKQHGVSIEWKFSGWASWLRF